VWLRGSAGVPARSFAWRRSHAAMGGRAGCDGPRRHEGLVFQHGGSMPAPGPGQCPLPTNPISSGTLR
jgi:hypothetical protein